MPRPLHRTVRRTLRFTAGEWAALESRIGGRDFSGFARAALLGGPLPEPRQSARPVITQRRMSEYEARKIQQLSWLGNNLNQIAKAANTGGASLEILAALLSLERTARETAP